jgi:hypothetical protein
MNEIAGAVGGQDTHWPCGEPPECGLEQHVPSGAAIRSGDERDGYALEVVSEAWKEIESTWRGPARGDRKRDRSGHHHRAPMKVNVARP